MTTAAPSRRPVGASSALVARWRATFFAPVGDGQTRRRGSDVLRIVLGLLALLLCWVASLANSSSEHWIATTLHPAPEGVRWLITSIWWAASFGIIALIVVLAVASRRWAVARDAAIAGGAAWVICVVMGLVAGPTGGRPNNPGLHGFDLTFPVARVAATVAVAVAALPYLGRWVQRTLEGAVVLLALATVVQGSGLPLAVVAALAVGWVVTATVHLCFGAPLGLPSAAELTALVADLGIAVTDAERTDRQEWGPGRFRGTVDGEPADISVYGRDASDTQFLTKAVRFVLYRDSGPTLTVTRWQQVEHEAYVLLVAGQAGVRVPTVIVAGPAGPARDGVLITRPPAGRPLSELPAFPLPAADAAATGAAAPGAGAAPAIPTADPPAPPSPDPAGPPALSDAALDDVFRQVHAMRAARITHGSITVDTIVVDEDDRCGLLDLRSAATMDQGERFDRDLAAALAACAQVAGPQRTVAAALRVVPVADLAAALPFLQRAALGPAASKALRGRKEVLTALRETGAAAAGVEVPKLIEARRISWVTLALVVGTLVGGWALIGVLVNVGRSWSTIKGADWAWVAVVFVLAQSAYPAIAVTTLGSVTQPLPYGRTVALEVSNTFVGLAGGSMAVLATRVRFFQQEGFDATLAVSSGVLVSTVSWIVKGALFLVSIPLAISQFHFHQPSDTGGGGGINTAHLVELLILVVVAVGVVAGILLAVPRWRRLAAAKLRPKASEVWGHLKVLSGHPRNMVEIFGGNTVAQVVVAMALGAALHAFGAHLNLAALIIVLTLGSMLGGVSPVPGGMGVVEAGMILGLTAAGISETVAVAAVFVQRLFTAYLPPIWGWGTLVWMRRREYL